jgi:hypothetical protein
VKRVLSGVLLGALFVVPEVARADDAREIAARVVEQWKVAGARTTALPSRFLFDDDKQLVAVGEATASEPCTYVALVAARGLSFRAKLSGTANDPLVPPEPAARSSSTAGVVELRRCDASRPVRSIELQSDAGRGAIEIIVAHGPAGLPQLASIIPERTGGSLPPMPEAGALSQVAPQEKRLEQGEARIRRDRGTVEPRTTLHASEDGTGDVDLDVNAGCHRFEVVARERPDRNGRRYRLDLDAELRDGDHVVARDRTEAPDARLETCVGRASRLNLIYAGAMPSADVVVAHGSWPLPARLPHVWGAQGKSRMARVMFVRHVAAPSDEPVLLAQGSAGTTPLAVPVEVGGCYVAVVAAVHGRPRQLQLRATVGARESVDERGAAEEAALTAFCVRAHETARVEVLARPSGLAWGLAVWRVKSGIWEAGR